jgi:hypothetical protein
MTLKLLALAGGLLTFVAAAAAVHLKRTRTTRITTDQLSGDWLAQARAREEQRW